MKIQVALKDPDGFYDCIRIAVEREIKDIPGLTESEKESMEESRIESTFEAISTWVEYQEGITIEFDTESKTATVLPQ